MDSNQTAIVRPDIVVGLVGPVGVNMDSILDSLDEAFTRLDYVTERIRLSTLIEETASKIGIDVTDREERYDRLMWLGSELRRLAGDGSIAGGLAITAIMQTRNAIRPNQEGQPIAFLLRQLKHDAEVELLRQTYGSKFLLIAVTSTRSERVERLYRSLQAQGYPESQARAVAEELVARDESEPGVPLGQQVRRAFPKADIFVDVSREPPYERFVSARDAIRRAINLVFGHPFHTPTREELAMFHAHAAALRSAALGRQVGCAITDSYGEIVATGSNEVGRAHGGQYWEEDIHDARDFRLGQEVSDKLNRQLVGDLLRRLSDAGWLSERVASDYQKLLDEALAPSGPAAGSRILDLLEFARVVHAEMAALMTAARRGVSVDDGTLYTTTFPCHECARHIVAAGISRVVYREPYPKSRVDVLYPDSIAVDELATRNRISFTPFVGVAPRLFARVFEADERKTDAGDILHWEAKTANPRLAEVDEASDELLRGREESVETEVARLLSRARKKAEEETSS